MRFLLLALIIGSQILLWPQQKYNWQNELDSLKRIDPFTYELELKAIVTRLFDDRKQKNNEEITRLEKSIESEKKLKNDPQVVTALIRLSILNERSGRYNAATQNLLEAFSIAELVGDSVSLGKIKIRLDDLNYVKYRVTVHQKFTREGVEYLSKSTDPETKALYHFIKAKLTVNTPEYAHHVRSAFQIQSELVKRDSSNVRALLTLASFMNSMGLLSDNPVPYLSQAIEIALKYNEYYLVLFYLNNLGYIYEEKKNYQSALQYYFKTFQFCIQHRYPGLLRNTTSNISRVYRSMGNHAEASRYAKLQILAIEATHEDLAEVKYDELKIQYELGKKEAELFDLTQESNELKKIAELEAWQKYILAFGLLVLMVVAIHIQIARKKIQRVKTAIEEEKNTVSLQKIQLEKLNHDLSENERILNDAQRVARLANMRWSIQENTLSYSENLPVILGLKTEEIKGDIRKLLLSKVLREDIRIYNDYMFGNHLLMKKNEATFRIFTRKNIRWIHSKFSVLKDELGDALSISFTIQDITRQKLEEAGKIKLAEQQTFTRKLIESQETERQRIAGELHDGLGQELLLLKSKTQLSILTPHNEEQADEKFREIGYLADNILQSIRSITFDLSPVHLKRVGLAETIQDSVAKINVDSTINFTCSIDDIDNILPHAEEVILFRIIQEILNNIIKHSRAQNVNIKITREERWARMTISDNGIGFNLKEKRNTGKGFGLGNIYNRVSMLKGKIRIESLINKGTDIRIKVPIKRYEKN